MAGALLREDEDHEIPRAGAVDGTAAMRRNAKSAGKHTSVTMATTMAEEEAQLESVSTHFAQACMHALVAVATDSDCVIDPTLHRSCCSHPG